MVQEMVEMVSRCSCAYIQIFVSLKMQKSEALNIFHNSSNYVTIQSLYYVLFPSCAQKNNTGTLEVSITLAKIISLGMQKQAQCQGTEKLKMY